MHTVSLSRTKSVYTSHMKTDSTEGYNKDTAQCLGYILMRPGWSGVLECGFYSFTEILWISQDLLLHGAQHLWEEKNPANANYIIGLFLPLYLQYIASKSQYSDGKGQNLEPE